MRRLKRAVFAIFGMAVATNLAFVGCGSDPTPDLFGLDDAGDESTSPSDDGRAPVTDGGTATDGNFVDAIVDGSRSADADVEIGRAHV